MTLNKGARVSVVDSGHHYWRRLLQIQLTLRSGRIVVADDTPRRRLPDELSAWRNRKRRERYVVESNRLRLVREVGPDNEGLIICIQEFRPDGGRIDQSLLSGTRELRYGLAFRLPGECRGRLGLGYYLALPVVSRCRRGSCSRSRRGWMPVVA
jgi:hypothetical protein